MTKKEDLKQKYLFNAMDYSLDYIMEEYAEEFAYFLLKNAMLNTRGKLYLKLTDAEIEQIIENAMKEFENI